MPTPTASYLEVAPITVYTHNGKNSIAPDGNFGRNYTAQSPPQLDSWGHL